MNEYNENTTHQIVGEPKYYKTKDVAEELGESESTIRFWCKSFEESIEIKRDGRDRMFTRHNIKQLKFAQELLRDKNYSVNRVKEMIRKKESEIVEELPKQEPLVIQALAKALAMEMQGTFGQMLENDRKERQMELTIICEELAKSQNNLINNITEKIDTSVGNSIEDIKNDVSEIKDNKEVASLKEEIITLKDEIKKREDQFKEVLEKQDKKAEERDRQLMEITKKLLEDKREKEEQQVEKKGIFKRFFGN